MQSILNTIQILLVCATLLSLALAILLSMPQSKLRAFVLPIVAWGLAIICGVYCLSPIDIVPEAFLGPFGLIDDIGAAVTGIVAARTAMKADKC